MFRFAPLFFVALAACGGGDSGSSGVDGSKKLIELSADERTQLCEFMVDAEGGAGNSKMCGDGITVTVKSAADCVAGFGQFKATCAATGDNAESCANAVGDDVCNLISSSSCSFLIQCLQ